VLNGHRKGQYSDRVSLQSMIVVHQKRILALETSATFISTGTRLLVQINHLNDSFVKATVGSWELFAFLASLLHFPCSWWKSITREDWNASDALFLRRNRTTGNGILSHRGAVRKRVRNAVLERR
jgi:hypothetical protein